MVTTAVARRASDGGGAPLGEEGPPHHPPPNHHRRRHGPVHARPQQVPEPGRRAARPLRRPGQRLGLRGPPGRPGRVRGACAGLTVQRYRGVRGVHHTQPVGHVFRTRLLGAGPWGGQALDGVIGPGGVRGRRLAHSEQGQHGQASCEGDGQQDQGSAQGSAQAAHYGASNRWPRPCTVRMWAGEPGASSTRARRRRTCAVSVPEPVSSSPRTARMACGGRAC